MRTPVDIISYMTSRFNWLSFFILAMSLLLVYSFVSFNLKISKSELKREFDSFTMERFSVAGASLLKKQQGLNSLSRFFAASTHVSEAEFKIFTEGMLDSLQVEQVCWRGLGQNEKEAYRAIKSLSDYCDKVDVLETGQILEEETDTLIVFSEFAQSSNGKQKGALSIVFSLDAIYDAESTVESKKFVEYIMLSDQLSNRLLSFNIQSHVIDSELKDVKNVDSTFLRDIVSIGPLKFVYYAASAKAANKSQRFLFIYLIGFLGLVVGVVLAFYINVVRQRNQEVKRLVQAQTKELKYANDALKLSKTAVESKNSELEKLNTALADSNSELEKFAYITSHDLKAPLRGISDLVEYIQEDLEEHYSKKLPDPVVKNFSRLHRQVLRMEGLIAGILAYSRVGSTQAKVTSVNVGDLIKELFAEVNPTSTVKLNILNSLPNLETDDVKLSQVFSNLISNAIKYHHDLNNAEISISSRRVGDFYEFSVADNGPGIDAKFHDRIFEIFQTLQSRDVIESTGIGLTIIKKLVTYYEGKITVISEVGSGAKFVFTWPIDIAAIDRRRKRENEIEGASREENDQHFVS